MGGQGPLTEAGIPGTKAVFDKAQEPTHRLSGTQSAKKYLFLSLTHAHTITYDSWGLRNFSQNSGGGSKD